LAYSEVFRYVQQERNCCATATDPFPLMESSINRIIAAIEEPAVIERILTHLKLAARLPPRAPARRVDLLQAA
jgi:hypothetical protein